MTPNASPSPRSRMLHRGSCHCGAVRFEAELDLSLPVSRCNCSICTKLGATGASIEPSAFTLLSPEAELGRYVWGEVSARYFCQKCGVYCFGKGHLDVLGGDFVSVNVNCLDDADPAQMKIVYFDGRHDNWQAGTRSEPWPIAPWPARPAA